MNPVGPLDAEKCLAAVFLYLFYIGFREDEDDDTYGTEIKLRGVTASKVGEAP